MGEGKREVDLCRSKIKAFCKDMKAEQTAWPTLSHEYHYHLSVCIWDDRQLLFCFVLFCFDTMVPTHVRHVSDLIILLRKQRKVKYISGVDIHSDSRS